MTLRKSTIEKQRTGTAYHEAGHAVVGYFENLRVRYATIKPKEQTFGHVQFGKHPRWFKPDTSDDPRQLDYAVRHVTVDFAGSIAERRFQGRAVHRYASSDYSHAVDWLSFFCGGEGELNACLAWLHKRACSAVETRWIYIEAVAEELLKRETLTGEDIRKIVVSTPIGEVDLPTDL